MPTVHSIPIVDFSEFKTNPEKVAQDVFNACTSIGFFYMVNHDIPANDIDKAFELSKTFFDLPREEKTRYEIGANNHGYSELFGQKLDPENQRQGDHKEGFNLRAFEGGKPYAPIPAVFQEHAEFLESLSKSCHDAALQILEAFAIALQIPAEQGGQHFFVASHNYKGSENVLRFLKYPRGAESEYKEAVRAGAHSDYGSVTLLFQKQVPGLEVQASRTEWIAAPLIPGAIIVNVGDQMELWTNGLFKSTMHRVTFQPEHNHLDRYSMPYFVQANSDTSLAPIPSPFVDQTVKDNVTYTAGEHLQRRLAASHGFKK
ncbi:hypothetical protein MBANPS3_010447 [Mucor bainieri]